MLTGAHFEEGDTVRRQKTPCRGRQLPILGESIRAAVKRASRLVAGDLWRQCLDLRRLYIGRIGDNDIRLPGNCFYPASRREYRTSCQTERRGITLRRCRSPRED